MIRSLLVLLGLVSVNLQGGEAITPNQYKVMLGRFLFHDKILSGNKNISCATCHHALLATGDALSLSVGEGGCGLGPSRSMTCGQKIHERVPRNSPPLFNLGDEEYTVMFADGRVEGSNGSFRSPANGLLPDGLDSALAVQALFPVTSGTEMAGQPGENPQADFAVDNDFVGIWDHVIQKVIAYDEYQRLFFSAYGLRSRYDITIVHLANAIAAFEAEAFKATESPYDRYVMGDYGAMTNNQITGKNLFYGKAQCYVCHSGKFQTNHRFYALAMPQIGPGKGDGIDAMEDFGRERVTKSINDRYRFRVPSLRNVALTGPWTHAGAYNTLKGVIDHHLQPRACLENWSLQNAILPWDESFNDDFITHSNFTVRDNMTARVSWSRVALTAMEIDRLIDFLHALTDPNSLNLRHQIPNRVPSGLPVFD